MFYINPFFSKTKGTNCTDFTMQHRHALATLQLVAVRKRAYVLRLCALSTDGCRVPAYALGKLYNSVTGQNDINGIGRKHVK